ncbi:MAG: peptidoglycan-binding protein [Gammaproteobacteria bacterium]|nr:peptidoglycan-binding protein [Gammaproteobacteria bacterium]
MPNRHLSNASIVLCSAFLLTTGHPATAQSGAAGGGTAQGANPKLEYCPESLGTLAVYEDQNETWWRDYYSRYPELGSTVPVLRLMVQQSNCFVVVERGKALRNVMGERELANSGELREGSDFGRGQVVAADYTMSPSILFAKNTGGLGGALGGFLGKRNKTLGAVAGGLKRKQASTTLLLIDNRSSVQIAAATGKAQKFDFKAGLGGLSGSAAGAVGGFTDTPEGKIIVAAFADSYNKMVGALRNYTTQNVKGGLGKGGKLKVGD